MRLDVVKAYMVDLKDLAEHVRRHRRAEGAARGAHPQDEKPPEPRWVHTAQMTSSDASGSRTLAGMSATVSRPVH